VLAPSQGHRSPEAREVDELDDGPVLHPCPLTAVRTDRRLDDRLDGDLEPADQRLDDLQHVHRGETNQQITRARSVEHSRGTSESEGFDTLRFAVPLLRARDPHTPLIREAPVTLGIDAFCIGQSVWMRGR
jgi:hypothetical protein